MCHVPCHTLNGKSCNDVYDMLFVKFPILYNGSFSTLHYTHVMLSLFIVESLAIDLHILARARQIIFRVNQKLNNNHQMSNGLSFSSDEGYILLSVI